MGRPRRKGDPHKGWKGAAQNKFRPALELHGLAHLIRDHHDENNPITEYLDAAEAVLAAFRKSAPHDPSSLPSGESDPLVTADSRGADTEGVSRPL